MTVLRAIRHLVFAVLVLVCVGLVALNAFAWRGDLVDDEKAAPTAAAAPATISSPAVPSAQTARSPGDPTDSQPRDGAVPAIAETQREDMVAVSATRGECWIEVRLGSSAGTQLYAGILTPGQTVRFTRKPLWISLGAAQNVDLVVDGKPARRLSSATVGVLVTRSGVEQL